MIEWNCELLHKSGQNLPTFVICSDGVPDTVRVGRTHESPRSVVVNTMKAL